MSRNLVKTDRTCPECSTTFGAVANHCVCPSCSNRFWVEHFEPREDPRVVEVPDLSPEHEAVLDDIEEQIAESLGPNTHAKYSAYECDANEIPVNNLDEIAIEGTIVIVAQSDDFFGGKDSVSYQSSPFTNPTWLDLCGILNEQVASTKDTQHVFIEGVIDTGRTVEIAGKTIRIFELDLGS